MSGSDPGSIAFTVNGRAVSVDAPPLRRLADALRDDLGLTGTKVGCNAGDCGACTVLLDGTQVCSCMVSLAQAAGRRIETVEGLAVKGRLNRLQRAFLRHGAAQCGACTPGMLIAATELLRTCPRPGPAQVMDGLGGVLCRCTGYRKIVAAVLDAAGDGPQPLARPEPGAAVGARLPKLDGVPKLTGAERYGADATPADALWLRIVRSPHESARVSLGDLAQAAAAWPGIVRVLTAADVPSNRIGIYPDLRDQPVLAEGIVRHRGDPVAALVGTREAVVAVRDAELPIRYEPLPAVRGLDEARAPGAPLVHGEAEGNRLIEGGVERGDAAEALAGCAVTAAGRFETAFVEHAYIEPEAGWARRVGERVELFVSTQTPVMDRDMTAEILDLRPEQVRIVPSACGGGFGGKLDVSIQPLTALAAWLTGATVACVYERPESMMATTKRHPSVIEARFGCDAEGRLQAAEVDAAFDTGAYASWGPTVAGRVPVHASGPYAVPAVSARGRALLHQRATRRRLPRLRRAAGRHRPRGADGRPRRTPRHGPAADPPEERAPRRRRHGDRPGAGGQCRARSLPRGAQSPLAARAGRRRARQRAGRPGAARRRHRLHVVRHRQHGAQQPVDDADHTRPGGPAHALQRRRRYRPGLDHDPRPDLRRCSRRCARTGSPR